MSSLWARTVIESALVCNSLLDGQVSPKGVPDMPVSEGMLLTYRVTGTGFLRHMVRTIVGTLVEIGAGRTEVAQVSVLLAEGRREAAGPTAPAAGLCLVAVDYADHPPAVATHR